MFLIFFSFKYESQATTWTGYGSSNDWDDPSNWTAGVPLWNSTVLIDDISTRIPHINIANAVVGDLTIANDAYILWDDEDYILDIFRDLVNDSSEPEVFGTQGIVRFTGAASTTVSTNNSARTVFNRMVLKKSISSPGHTLTLNSRCYVRDYLELIDGGLVTMDNLTLTSTFTSGPVVFHTAFIVPYDVNDTGIVGDVIMEQSVVDSHKTWHWLSSPVTNTINTTWTLDLLMDNTSNQNFNSSYAYPAGSPPDWVFYDERIQDPNTPGDEARYGWKGVADEFVEFDSMQAVCGSFVASSNLIDWKGFPTNGTITSYELNYTNHSESADGINLVGNPYPWPIDWQHIWTRETVATGGNLGPMIWLWQNDGVSATGGYFYIWDAQLYDNDPNPANWPAPGQYNSEDAYYKANPQIAIGQGFEVQVDVDGITFNVEQSDFTLPLDHGHQVPFIRLASEQNALNLKLSGNGNNDFLTLRWESDVREGYQFGKDGIKHFNPGNNFYTMDGGKSLMFERRPIVKQGEKIPLYLDLFEAGLYEISWTKKVFDSEDFDVYFEDSDRDLFIKIDQSFDYSFVAKKGKNDQRFFIHLVPKNQVPDMFGANKALVSYADGMLKLSNGKNDNGIENITLYSNDGRIVNQSSIVFENGKAVWPIRIEPGAYIVKLDEKGEVAEKLIVSER